MTATMDTDWDIDYYKTIYESDEHWTLRRGFMEAHKDKFPENELVCLAQVFTNMEFLGCRYPEATMRKVAMLSQEVAAEYRKKRENTLKRTFVGAQEAAGAKAKGRKSATTAAHSNTISNTSLKSSFQSNTESLSSHNFQATSTQQQPSNSRANQANQPQLNAPKRNREWKKRIGNVGFILYETLASKTQPSINTLQMSAAKQGANFKVEYETTDNGKHNCVVYINNVAYGSALVTDNKKDAKTQACDWALENARQLCYTITQKEGHKSVNIQCDGDTKTEPIQLEAPPTTQDTKINADNKGFKMMKLLGWSGGALGTTGSGIEEPISVQVKVDRKGLGLSPSDSSDASDNNLNRDYFMKYLNAYKHDESAIHELVFSKDFTKEERKILHEIVNRLGLKSKSKNLDNGDRFLIIHKKVNLYHLANDILNDGPYADIYELIVPANQQSQQSDEPERKRGRGKRGF